MKFVRTLVLALTAAVLAACSTTSPDVVKREDANRMATVLDGVVLSVRQVRVEGSQSGVGAVAGGAVGAIGGSSIGSGRDGKVGGILGAVAGAVVGNTVERVATREDAYEILVQLPGGERRAIVQAQGGEVLQAGDAVIIVTQGGRVRVSRAPGAAGAPVRPAP
jgi:outer membrane lipoprotein SlyB